MALSQVNRIDDVDKANKIDQIDLVDAQEIEKVLADLERAGVKVSLGNITISNKPTINSTH